MNHIVELSGIYTGFSVGNPQLLGIMITGKRKILKWLYCDDEKIMNKIIGTIAVGTRVRVSVLSVVEENRLRLLDINPVS